MDLLEDRVGILCSCLYFQKDLAFLVVLPVLYEYLFQSEDTFRFFVMTLRIVFLLMVCPHSYHYHQNHFVSCIYCKSYVNHLRVVDHNNIDVTFKKFKEFFKCRIVWIHRLHRWCGTCPDTFGVIFWMASFFQLGL